MLYILFFFFERERKRERKMNIKDTKYLSVYYFIDRIQITISGMGKHDEEESINLDNSIDGKS